MRNLSLYNKPLIWACRFTTLFLCGALLFFAGTVSAQQTPAQGGLFELKARAASALILSSGQNRVYLWGIEEAEGMSPAFNLKARTALDNAIGGKALQCETKGQRAGQVFAQCVNGSDLDLGLYMLQQGFVSVDRGAVYGTVFEEAYIQAETQAQDQGLGIWAEPGKAGGSSSSGEPGWMLSLGLILFLCIIGAFTVVSIIIMRGFRKVTEAQTDNVEMMSRERKLRDKERAVVAVMLDSEIKANRSKVEAYIVVYEEMLNALKDPDRPPKYKKSGDLVQKQPALDRSVFDNNTDKLDTLGDRLSSEVIHYYARIKSKPEYLSLEPEIELPEAIAMLEGVLKNARRLNQISERLIEAFSRRGTMMDAPADGDEDSE